MAEVGSKSRWVKIRLYKKQWRFHNYQGGQTVKFELINQYLLQLYTHIKLNFKIDVGQLTTLFVHCLRHWVQHHLVKILKFWGLKNFFFTNWKLI